MADDRISDTIRDWLTRHAAHDACKAIWQAADIADHPHDRGAIALGAIAYLAVDAVAILARQAGRDGLTEHEHREMTRELFDWLFAERIGEADAPCPFGRYFRNNP